MTTNTTSSAVMARRKTLFGRALILTALVVVAAAGSVLCARSARADAPVAPPKEDVSVEAQTVASALAAQSVGNPVLGASFMQVIWGGGIKDEPIKILPSYEIRTNRARHRVRSHGADPRERETASSKLG